MSVKSAHSSHRFAQQVRERFVDALDAAILDLLGQIHNHLMTLAQSDPRLSAGVDLALARDAARQFLLERQTWMTAARRDWRDALAQVGGRAGQLGVGGLSLIDDELIERKIIASRLAAPVVEAAGAELSDLRLRIQYLERSSDLPANDVLLPETLAQILVKGWVDCGLTRPMWALVHAVVESVLVHRFPDAYRQANSYLVEQGVMAEIDMRSLMRRPGGGEEAAPAQTGRAHPAWQRTAPGGRPDSARTGGRSQGGGYRPSNLADPPDVRASALARAAHETRMQTGMSPMARMQQRAQGVLGQLRRMLNDRVAGFDLGASGGPPSPALAQALAAAEPAFEATQLLPGHGGAAQSGDVQVMARRLRERAAELKAKAEKPGEKATIEIVALMFQAILAEERIPPAIRVWFARLQIPVLRLALAEPDFFASTHHPARQLIDRMGGCALGFDNARIGGSRLEAEIKRIVQVVEQYPETGRRVYEMVLEEFKRFLGSALTEGQPTEHAATLAQQVEQKEALAIQYTIELRRMLERVPVSDAVREFLFRVWSEVLALAAVRKGTQAADSLRYKQAAADLLWSVSPKSDRTERSRVVQQLAGLLHTLRDGMGTLAIDAPRQDAYIKRINDAVTEAFVSRAEGLAPTKLAELSRGLAGLEDVVSDDAAGDVLLDPGMIELMFGAEGGALEVIAVGGSQPTDAMLQWARELELGAWFALDYQGSVSQAQYVWRSQRGQLHLFAAGAERSYLVQTRRMASYLQAGLLVPLEDEALTVRATRTALEKLNAQPDQLLH